jgi:hypothetical protein
MVERVECIVDPTALNALLDILEQYLSERYSSQSRPNVGIKFGKFICTADAEPEDAIDEHRIVPTHFTLGSRKTGEI